MSILPKPGLIYLLDGGAPRLRYIGQTYSSVNVRLRQHKSDAARGVETALYHAVRKHGWESFAVKVLAQGFQTLEGLNAAERYFIAALDTFHNGLNCTTGGDRDYVVSESTRRKMRKPRSPAHCANISAAKMGHAVSQKTRDKISATKTGVPCGPCTESRRKAISAAKRGVPLSATHREALSVAQTARRLRERARKLNATQKEIQFAV